MLFVATVWMINLYNFMDGRMGLRGMALMLWFLLCLRYFRGAMHLPREREHCGFFFGILLFNFHPAKVFMGMRSIPLVFGGSIGTIGWQEGSGLHGFH